jgi:hypothetical protein
MSSAALPVALTHGFKGGFMVAAILCAAAAALALALVPRRKPEPDNEQAEVLHLSFTRCPGAPYCGYLARLVAFGQRVFACTRRRSPEMLNEAAKETTEITLSALTNRAASLVAEGA